jgi:hypothetical protein
MDVYFQLQEFKAFADLRRRLEPLSMAIFAYGKVNGLLTKEDLKRAAQHVRFLVPSLACLFIVFCYRKSKLTAKTK